METIGSSRGIRRLLEGVSAVNLDPMNARPHLMKG